MHPMDAHPGRFGWRLWNIDRDPFRLSSPIHRGQLRTGGRFVEAVCAHREDRLNLADDCHCGIYFEHAAASAERWRRKVLTVPDVEVALTFGAAVGDVAGDPNLPGQASRAPRYSILAILLPRAHPAAGDLRTRYGANVHQRVIDVAALEHVEDAVRGDIRRTDPEQFWADLRAEPYTADSGHIADRRPEAFGWRLWKVDPITGTLSDVDLAPHRVISERKSAAGPVYFEASCTRGHRTPSWKCRCGLDYVSSAFYCEWTLAQTEQIYRDGGCPPSEMHFAATYGWADGGLVEAGVGFEGRRGRRHHPMAICIPLEVAHLQSRMEKRFGMGVVVGMNQHVFRGVEKLARAKLVGQ